MKFPDFEVHCGQDPRTKKWHAFYYEPGGSRMTGPARDTPIEASNDGEAVLEMARREFTKNGFVVGERKHIQ